MDLPAALASAGNGSVGSNSCKRYFGSVDVQSKRLGLFRRQQHDHATDSQLFHSSDGKSSSGSGLPDGFSTVSLFSDGKNSSDSWLMSVERQWESLHDARVLQARMRLCALSADVAGLAESRSQKLASDGDSGHGFAHPVAIKNEAVASFRS